MTELTGFYFYFDFSASDVEKLQAKKHYKELVQNVSKILYQQEVEVRVEFRDGSLEMFLGIVGAIYLAIGQYGSFRAGVNQIIEDAKTLKKIIISNLNKHGVRREQIKKQKRLTSTPDRIRKLFLKIDRFENNSKSLTDKQKKNEIRSIIKSVSKLVHELEYKEDYELFLSSIKDIFIPDQLPEYYYYLSSKEEIQDMPHITGNVGLLTDLSNEGSNKLLPSNTLNAYSSYFNNLNGKDSNKWDIGPFRGFRNSKKSRNN